MSIKISNFGKSDKKENVSLFTVTNKNGMVVSLTDWGATMVSILVPDKNKKMRDVVLGFDNVDNYLENYCFFGATVGRNGNRIGNASFKIDGKTYNISKNERNKNNLHSGPNGYQKRLWNYKLDETNNSIAFSILSPDMDQGYPGNFNITVTYTLTDDNSIKINYHGVSDKDTLANMTNHSYFNLNGHNSGSILNHLLQINSKKFAIVDDESIPTGELREVNGTPLDFTKFRRLADDINNDFDQLKKTKGYDHSFLLDKKTDGIEKAAILKSEESGITMEVYTDCKAVQFYAGNYLDDVPQTGKGGYTYGFREGLCLETGFLPNAINIPSFASPILKAGKIYDSTTIYKFI